MSTDRRFSLPSPELSWQDMLDRARKAGLLGRQLYVVHSDPTAGLGPVLENLKAHVAHQQRLEREGVMFAAGPLAGDDGQSWLGEGMFIYRAESLAQARGYAEADPMHQSGARRFRIRLWLLNEGSSNVRVFYSTGGREVN